MGRIVLLFTSLIAMTALTICAYWFELNGQTTIASLNRLPVLFSPANYVYLLVIVIFASFFIWLVNYYKNRHSALFISPLQTALFIFISVLQICGLLTWHHELYNTSIVMLVLQLLFLFGLYVTYPLNKEGIHNRLPIALFLSWTFFFFFAIISFILVSYEWSALGLSNAFWAVVVMTVSTAIALHLRYHHDDIVSPLVFIWGFINIVIKNGFEELLVSTAALFLCGVLIAGIFFMKKTRK